jgi:hypothetical protein
MYGSLEYERLRPKLRVSENAPESFRSDVTLPDALMPVYPRSEWRLRIVGVKKMHIGQSEARFHILHGLAQARSGADIVSRSQQVARVQTIPNGEIGEVVG